MIISILKKLPNGKITEVEVTLSGNDAKEYQGYVSEVSRLTSALSAYYKQHGVDIMSERVSKMDMPTITQVNVLLSKARTLLKRYK